MKINIKDIELEKYMYNIDIKFLLDFSNKDINSNWFSKLYNNVKVSKEELLKDIQVNGINEPFFICCCEKEETIRLETGNKRILLLKYLGIKNVPCIFFSYSSPIFLKENGEHFYNYNYRNKKYSYKEYNFRDKKIKIITNFFDSKWDLLKHESFLD